MGLRAEESPARAKREAFTHDKRASNITRRHVDEWLPIHDWATEEVWARIRETGVPHHWAYDLGMPRLSCVFCMFAPREALMIGGQHNPQLLAEYVAVEERIGHRFRQHQPLVEIQTALGRGERPKPVTTWARCA
jgi:3'-phosphoadenosine 5'-phosphosulfate sulfotransferase (PAPS reductase)/FAD synthetase